MNGVEFAVAGLTHLTRDHLDYHGTPEAYAAAKRRLFHDHQPGRAVLNLDDAFGRARRRAARLDGSDRLRPGRASGACGSVRLGRGFGVDPGGIATAIRSSWGDGELSAGLLGRFNASNLLAALATLLALDLPLPGHWRG